MKRCRRTFLATMGLGPALLPTLATDRAQAGCLGTPPRRAIFVIWTNGYQDWVTATEAAFTLPDYMKALEPYKADILPIKSLKYQNLIETPNPLMGDNFGHGATPFLLTGRAAPLFTARLQAGPSVDQFLAGELPKKGISTPRSSLVLGALAADWAPSWRGSAQPVVPDNDPWRVFADLFGGRSADVALQTLRQGRKSLLDLALRDLNGFRARVGKDHQLLIDAHLGSVREIERSLQAPLIPTGCTVPDPGAAVTVTGVSDGGISASYKMLPHMPLLTKLQIDLTVAALAADVARTAVIQIGGSANNWLMPLWLGVEPANPGAFDAWDANNHHSAAHKGGDLKRKIDAWHVEQFAYLLGRLKGEREGAGTMLDNVAALFINHMGNGGGHTREDVPWVLAGRCGGHFQPGRNITVTNLPHTAVLGEVCRAMGVDPTPFVAPTYASELPALRG